MPLALTHAAPACGYHGLRRSNHTLLYISKVGRPGAHRLVRVLYSYHEVSGLSLSLRPGGTRASISYVRPCLEQGISSVPPFSFFGATFILWWTWSGHPQWGTGSDTGVVLPQVRGQYWVADVRHRDTAFQKMSPQKTPVSLPALSNSSAPGYNHSFAVPIRLTTIPFSRLINLTSVPGLTKCQLSRSLFIAATEPHS